MIQDQTIKQLSFALFASPFLTEVKFFFNGMTVKYSYAFFKTSVWKVCKILGYFWPISSNELKNQKKKKCRRMEKTDVGLKKPRENRSDRMWHKIKCFKSLNILTKAFKVDKYGLFGKDRKKKAFTHGWNPTICKNQRVQKLSEQTIR